MTLNTKAMIFLAAAASDIRAGGKKYDQDLPSPCMSVCQMDEATGLCQGCLRTLDEIRDWGGASQGRKREIWQNIEVRCAHYSE